MVPNESCTAAAFVAQPRGRRLERPAPLAATAPQPPEPPPAEPPPAEPATPAGNDGEVDEKAPPAPSGSPPETAGGEFFVVGIGASAGGLEAVGELVRYLPAEGLAYIVIQHLAPDHESLLTQLLARGSRMQVITATDGMMVEPGHVYVIPPNVNLAIMHGAIRIITAPGGRGPHFSVDYLFRSLADELKHLAIGIVLSGTGTDGTLGLKAIKGAGGFTFVQEPSTAKFDGMPRSALASGVADYCLPPKAIAEELARIARRPRVGLVAQAPESAPEVQDQLAKLFVLIRSEFGNDLTQYKHSTLDRRIERRMTFRKIDRLEDYVSYVQKDRNELQALYKDLLITVTSFVRDPEAFAALKTTVLPQLVEAMTPGRPIRVWVPACATGEEAYSIAMCLIESFGEGSEDQRIQIFASDIEADAIQHARRGVYSANIALDVSPERLNRFFVKKDGEFQVARRIRDMIVFSRQNVLRDPPFSRLDLVSCRNLLIYLQPSAQEKLLRLFNYALNPDGDLFLGNSETVGDAPTLFTPIDRKNKIYAKHIVAPHAAFDPGRGSTRPIERPHELTPAHPTLTLQALADRKVLELYGPAGVVVSEQFEILQFRGHTGPFLDPAPGIASLDLLKVARFELHVELKRAIYQARAEQRRVTTDITYQQGGQRCPLRIDIVPLQEPQRPVHYLLVLFLSSPPSKASPVPPEQGSTGEAMHPLRRRIEELEGELAAANECLRTMMEEKETALEELKGANEELQSANEELQSTNEELETSREEMQSTNEELTTVNDELQNRMAQLSQTNDDLYNVLLDIDHVVVIIGMDLQVRRYTRAAEKLLSIAPGEGGCSIGVLDCFLGPGTIEPRVTGVIQSLSTLEETVLASNQRWYTLRVSPYKTLDHAIRGAVVTLVDIDIRKRASDMMRDVGAYAAKFLGAIGHPLLIIDQNLRIVWANDIFLSTFQLSSEETVGTPLPSLGTRQFADAGLHEALERVFAAQTLLRGHVLHLRAPEGAERTASVGASLIPAVTGVPLALMSIEPTEQGASRAAP